MSVKKNFAYNGVLLVSQYIFPMLVFPYITRTFGAGTLGLVSFVDGIAEYFILFSTLGLTLTGLRAVAKYRDNKAQLSKTFSELLIVHIISTLVIISIYIILILTVDKMHANKELFYISISKLIFNVFLIEWFYRGIENFKFITVRSIFIKIAYVILIFLFVKTRQDYTKYYILTCSVVVFNATVNFSFVRKSIFFTLKDLNIKQHVKAFYTVGLYLIVTSMYTSFNIGFLGFVSSNVSVGYYSIASKLFSIILGFFGALNTVLMPRLSSLMAHENEQEFIKLIDKSFGFVITFCFPIMMCGLVLARPIIYLISGPGFEGAVICFRLIIPLIFILGIAQILANQILMSIRKDKELLIASVTGGLIGLSLNIALVPKFHELGTSLVLLVSELAVTGVLLYFTVKHTSIRMPYQLLIKNFFFSIPYLIISYIFMNVFLNSTLILLCSAFFSILYFITIQIFTLKNQLLTPYYNNIKSIFN